MHLTECLLQDGHSLTRVSQTEYAGPCPWCGGRDRFRVWPDEGETGRWWCRRCLRSGDGIAYVRLVRGLSYVEACAVYAQAPRPVRHRWRSLRTRRLSVPLNGLPVREYPLPAALWMTMADAYVRQAEQALWSEMGTSLRLWLQRQRGLQEQTIRRRRLGLQPTTCRIPRTTWGLMDRPDGKPLWFPGGLVIPAFHDGQVSRLRIRRPTGCVPRYVTIPGSCMAPIVIGWSAPGAPGAPTAAVVVVESELDGMLLAQERGGLPVTVAALGAATIAPDPLLLQQVSQTPRVLIALDQDAAGAIAARQWQQRFPHAIRWPVPAGKDPGDARQQQVDVQLWLAAGLLDKAVDAWVERAAIMEWEGGIPRAEAEYQAFVLLQTPSENGGRS